MKVPVSKPGHEYRRQGSFYQPLRAFGGPGKTFKYEATSPMGRYKQQKRLLKAMKAA